MIRNEDRNEHDEDTDTSEIEEDKVVLITENKVWNKGDFRKNQN